MSALAANGVARIFVWRGPPGRCHPVDFALPPEADQIRWGGGSSINCPWSTEADQVRWGGGGSGTYFFR